MDNIVKRNPTRMRMSLKTAACGVAVTVAVATSLILTGVRIAAGGNVALNVIVALCSTTLLGTALFSAWISGRIREASPD